MNAPLTAAQLTEETSIANRAMKVVFHRGVGAARRVRDTATEQHVKALFGDEGQIVTKKLFTNKQGLIYKRSQRANEMYSYHMKATLPHADDGSRILPNAMFLDYSQKMAAFEQELQALDTQILQTYDHLVMQDVVERNVALTLQGKAPAAIASEYPSLQEMQRYLYVDWHVEPISTANDFRYEVDEHVKARLDRRLADVTRQAKADIFARMLPHMKHFIAKLSVPIGEPGAVFRDSLVENLNELTQELPKLNFDGDPAIDQMISELKTLVTPYVFNPDALREQPEVRSAARTKMAELMKKLDGYGLGR